MNIEHRTLNVQHPIMYSVNLKNAMQAYSAEPRGYQGQERFYPSKFSVFRSSLQRDSFASISKKHSVINIRRSMFDVRCSTFKAYSPPLEDLLFRPGGVSYEYQETRVPLVVWNFCWPNPFYAGVNSSMPLVFLTPETP